MQDIDKSPVDRAFKVLCDTAIKSYNEREPVGQDRYYNYYSHLLLTVNNPQAVVYNSEIMRYHSELIRIIGLDIKTISLYRNDITDLLLRLAAKREGKRGVDGVILGNKYGKLIVEEGTRFILSTAEDESVIEDRRGRNPTGAGRIVMQRVSTLPEVNAFMMSGETYEVIHYAGGKRKRLFDPSRRTNSEKGVIIEGDGEERVIPYEEYKF